MNTTPEPTEEQRQAAADHSYDLMWHDTEQRSEALANFIAEREAKLREEYQSRAESFVDLVLERQTLQEDLGIARAENDTLRARVAELTKARDDMDARAGMYSMHLDEASEREAQHLADIKELMRSCCVAMDAIDDGDSVAARNELSEATERLAHYDDAKADAPAVVSVWDEGARYRADLSRDTEGGVE